MLAEDGPPNKRLVFKLTHFEESRLLDLRYWYHDKKTAEFRPTAKGLSLTRKNFQCLKDMVDAKSEEILDWLSISYVPKNVADYDKRQADKNSDLELETPNLELKTSQDERDTAFFHVSRSGNDAAVTLNTAHPFVTALLATASEGDGEALTNLVAKLLLCLAQSQDSLADSPATHSSILFDQVNHNWSRLLRRAASKA